MKIPARLIITLLLLVGGLVLGAVAYRSESDAVTRHLIGYPQSAGMGHEWRPWLLASLPLIPALLGLIYLMFGRLDRYMLRHFYSALLICFSALILIWVLVDLQDNLSDFQNSGNALTAAFTFYLAQLPIISVIILPNTLLFSLLYVLGRMSASKEIVATIQAGRSVPRIVFPLLIVGLVCTYACLIFNYHWAPYAEGAKDRILDRAAGRQESSAENVVYFAREPRRLWSVGSFPADLLSGEPLENVTVTVGAEGRSFVYRLLAEKAYWSPEERIWTFQDALYMRNEEPAPLQLTKTEEPVSMDWKETPWQIIQPGLSELHLGIPGLNSWLAANSDSQWTDRRPYVTQWHYRFAQPFICIVTIMLAAPLGIVFSRRGTAGGVIIAVVLCAMMLLSGNVFLALGEAGFLPPVLAAWATNLIFAAIAIVLFQRRIAGRPIYQTVRSLFTKATA